jgi:hypothetical protein
MLNSSLKRSESKGNAASCQKEFITGYSNTTKTPSIFSLVNAILFQQKLAKRKQKSQQQSVNVENIEEGRHTEEQKRMVKRKISISLKQTKSLPLKMPLKQKISLPADAIVSKTPTASQQKFTSHTFTN